MDGMTAQTLKTRRGTILYDAALIDHADHELFSPAYWSGLGALRTAIGGRGSAWIVGAGPGEWVLRHYRRGGLVARLVADLYIGIRLERARPWREWRLLSQLHERGLPVPRPVAAQVVRAGPCYRGDLITVRIPDARSLAECIGAAGRPVPWRSVGACIRRFHDAGVWHADLNAHNILIDSRGVVHLIDFDRARIRTPQPSWQRSNLDRLQRSLRKLSPGGVVDAPGWEALLAGYRSRN